MAIHKVHSLRPLTSNSHRKCATRLFSHSTTRQALSDDIGSHFPRIGLPRSAQEAPSPREQELLDALRSPNSTPSSSNLDIARRLAAMGQRTRTAGSPSSSNKPSQASIYAATMVRSRELRNHFARRWTRGDVYAPHDLSPSEQSQWRKYRTRDRDVFDSLALNPIDEWKNVSVLEEFRTQMGSIKHRDLTGLRAVNQRRISKAIRRAVAMGIIPSVHRHPEILEEEERKRNERRFGLDGRRGIMRQ